MHKLNIQTLKIERSAHDCLNVKLNFTPNELKMNVSHVFSLIT